MPSLPTTATQHFSVTGDHYQRCQSLIQKMGELDAIAGFVQNAMVGRSRTRGKVE